MSLSMDADEEVHASSSSAQGNGASAQAGSSSLDENPPAYRLFLGDSVGDLKMLRLQCPPLPTGHEPPLPVTVALKPRPTTTSSSGSGDRAVQKMAAGVIAGVGWVIALARRNATIDVVLPSQPRSDTDADAELQASLLVTISNPKMKAGLQRWVGLAIGSDGVFAATSAGDFAYTRLGPVGQVSDAEASTSTSSRPSTSTPRQISVESTQRLELPEPLQSLVFHPQVNPTHFLYGGEEVPLSIWDIGLAFSPQTRAGTDDGDAEAATTHSADVEATGNAKLRKRKRQAEAKAKARELLWGEVWRAKNLPNDALSLPQRPNVTSIAVVESRDQSPERPCRDSDQAASHEVPNLLIAVGTRDGLLRLFDPASGARKHTRQCRVVAEGQSASVRSLTCPTAGSTDDTEVIAADSSGKLSVVDWEQGRLKYQWKDITGAISAVVPLLPPSKPESDATSDPLVFSSSMDRILRLHTMPSKASLSKTGSKRVVMRGQNMSSIFTGGSIVTAAVWDGEVPTLPADADGNEADESMRKVAGDDSDEEAGDGRADEDDDDEDVWQGMQEVGEVPNGTGRRRGVGKAAGSEGSDGEASDGGGGKAEALREQTSKRNRQ
ncbi:unnamed protein product [Parajaminaea phylloscopi]